MKSLCSFSVLLLVVTAPWALATPIPLGDVANVPLVDDIDGDGIGGWTDQGAENSLTGFPTGEVAFEGIPFVIPPVKSNAAVAFQNPRRPHLPALVSIPAGGVTGKFLYILSACAFEFSRGQEVAAVTVRYAEGTSQVEPLVYERQTGAWWTPSTPDEGVVAWHGKNALDVPIGVYLSWIRLTGSPVEAVDFRVANAKGTFLLVGLSISDASGVKIPPRWLPEPLSTDAWFSASPLRDNGQPSIWDELRPETDRSLSVELDFPMREVSPGEAAKLARTVRLLGYNAVHLPSLETFLPPVGSAVTSGADPVALESLRSLVAALKNERLAVSLTLGGGRKYGIDDGVAAYRQINNMLANQFFVDADATRLLLDSARSTTDVQPVSVSLLTAPVLLGSYESLFTPPHRKMLQNAWGAWLQDRYASNDKLVEAWREPGNLPPLPPRESLSRSGVDLLNVHDFSAFHLRYRKRFADQLQFLEDLQAGWFSKVTPEVRKIFPAAVIFSPGWLVTDKLGDFQARANAPLDGIEERIGDTFVGTGTEGSAYFFNRIAGKPFLVSENASAWPGDYEFARLLLTMVFGGLQGWDGILHRRISTLAPTGPMALPDKTGNCLQNPAFLAVLPLGRHLFVRGDLDRAPLVFSRVLESPSSFREHGPAPFPPVLQNLLFVGRVEASVAGSSADKATAEASSANVLKSLTGQVECDLANDLLKISTPASVAVAGKNGGAVEAGSARLESRGGYGVVYATTLDREPLASTGKILLGAVGRTRNSGQTVDFSNGPLGLHEHLWRIQKPGGGAILMEPSNGVLTLSGASAGSWTLQPLNLLGQPLDAKPKRIFPKDGTLRVEFDNKTSPLFLLRHEAK